VVKGNRLKFCQRCNAPLLLSPLGGLGVCSAECFSSLKRMRKLFDDVTWTNLDISPLPRDLGYRTVYMPFTPSMTREDMVEWFADSDPSRLVSYRNNAPEASELNGRVWARAVVPCSLSKIRIADIVEWHIITHEEAAELSWS